MLLKLFSFNIAMIIGFFIAIKFLGIPEDSFVIFGISIPWVFLLFGNVVFLMYDYSLTGLVSLYMTQIHFSIKKLLHLK